LLELVLGTFEIFPYGLYVYRLVYWSMAKNNDTSCMASILLCVVLEIILT